MRTRYRALAGAGLGILLAGGLDVRAQQPLEPEAGPLPMAGGGMFMAEGPDRVVSYAFGTASVDDKVVKNAPYAAEAVTEFVQTLGDGNRISRKTSASVYRDGQGRTRREQSLGAIVPLPGGADSRPQIFINDPVTHTSYVLDPQARTVQKLEVSRIFVSKDDPAGRKEKIERPKGDVAGPAGRSAGPPLASTGVGSPVVRNRTDTFTIAVPGPDMAPLPPPLPPPGAAFGMIAERSTADEKAESLGKQTIEGVEAEGTRTVVTIAAGEIGNEQPLQIVTERWYSPDLQTVVLSRHSDPRFGETTYRLTSIVRGEPDRALFEVPSDFKTVDQPVGDVLYRKVERQKVKVKE
jgi:hypothetical protein